MIGSTRVSVKRATVSCTMRSSSLSSERTSYRSVGLSGLAAMRTPARFEMIAAYCNRVRGCSPCRSGTKNMPSSGTCATTLFSTPIRHSVRHMPGRHVLTRRFDIVRRVVEKDVGAEGLEERPLVAAAEEQRLIQAHAPVTQGEDHALVRGRGTCSDQRRANRRALLRERFLQAMQRGEKAAERPA